MIAVATMSEEGMVVGTIEWWEDHGLPGGLGEEGVWMLSLQFELGLAVRR